jgi:hypothetical protein
MPKKRDQWDLLFAAGFIVEPSKGLEADDVLRGLKGSIIEIDTLPREFFLSLFLKQSTEYPIEVAFTPQQGAQRNEVRGFVRAVLFGNAKEKGDAARDLAARLALATDQRSQEGLFIILTGQSGDMHRVVLWKFPTDQTLQADIISGTIRIRLVEDAFSRESTYFKAAMFEGPDASRSIWKGKIEDMQAKQRIGGAAEFWTTDFLAAEPIFTDVHGTRVLAKALKKIIAKTKAVEAVEDLVAAARVLRGQGDRNVSIREVADEYLPESVREDFIKAAGGPAIADDVFSLAPETLETEFRLKSITLDRKFIIRGPLEEFDEVVRIAATDERGVVNVSLKGRITSELILPR